MNSMFCQWIVLSKVDADLATRRATIV